MNREQARKLIKDTFEESFDKNNFINFVVNLLNLKREDLEKTKKGPWQGNLIPEPFKHTIHKYERVTKYFAENNRIDILIVYLKRQTSIERARTKLRNFIAGYLKGNYGSDRRKDAALVAFVSPENQDWRFSLVKIDYSFKEPIAGKIKVNEEFTSAKRWSFLVGKNEKSHTAQSRFTEILEKENRPTLEDLEEAFNVEIVTDEFFQKYRDLFIKTNSELDKIVKQNPEVKQEFQTKNISTVDFTKKLLSQITFLYFLQKKGWFGVPDGKKWGEGNKTFIRDLFKKCGEDKGKYFFKDCLVPLFYDTLNNPRSNQADPSWSEHFNCKMPFLNGGLFESIYDWVNVKILIPNELFSNTNKTKEGDIGDGILDIFDRFNFTVNEEEPLEKEVALDPELLGKIYEKLNAIREDNFEEYEKVLKSGKKREKAKFNKEYGVYYTPREIVHYMCQESLISYLKAKMKDKVSRDDLEEFVKIADSVTEIEAIALEKEEKIQAGDQKTTRYETQIPENIRSNAKELDQLLDEIKVLDPAVGSGAFLIGMMHEIVRLRKLLSIYLDKEVKIYNFKLSCIENSLYGVDIDNGAVEICKLRFWLSMIVDEEDFHNIKPLPNLDYKVVRGNSLLGFPENWDSSISREINNLMHLYFKETNPKRKKELKDDIDSKINSRLENSEKNFGYKIDFDFKLFFSEVFLQKGGFDVVIANPPYIKEYISRKAFDGLRGSPYYKGKMDIWYFFACKGIDLLKKDSGILTFIAQNNWVTNYGASIMRNKIIKDTQIIQMVDFGSYMIFESSDIQTMVMIFRADSKVDNYKFDYRRLTGNGLNFNDVLDLLNCNQNSRAIYLKPTIQRNKFLNKPLTFSNKIIDAILDKLSKQSNFKLTENEVANGIHHHHDRVSKNIQKKLGNKFNIGDGIFVLSNKEKDNIPFTQKELALIKPSYTTKELGRYYANRKNSEWVIYTDSRFKYPENIKPYPNIKRHLDKFQKVITSDNKPYGLHRARDEKFFKGEKIISVRKCTEPTFTYTDFDCYVSATFYIIKTERINLKYLTALLNSRLIAFWLRHRGKMQGNNYQIDKEPLLALPLKNIPDIAQKPFIDLVDKILKITKDADYLKNLEKQAKVKEYEKQIDQLVYKLYGLTEEEIKIVEGKT